MYIHVCMYVKLCIYMYVCMYVHTCGDSAINYLHIAFRKKIDACILLLWLFICVCTAVMWSDIVERAERDRLMAMPVPGWDLSRMIVNLSVHFLPKKSGIECRLLGRAATPPRPLVLLPPPLVAVLPDRYKKSNRKHNCYSMTIIWTHKCIQKHIQTYIHAWIYTYILHT